MCVAVLQEKGAAARGRNRAIHNAKYEHILSTDMGVRLCEEWCEELIRPFEQDQAIEVVAGNTQIDRESVRTAVAWADFYANRGGKPKLGPGFVPGNRSIAYKKSVWRRLGGLPEDLTFYADDSVFGRQINLAGCRIAYARAAMTHWSRPERFRDFWKESFNYGRGDGEAAIKTPFAFRLYEHGFLPSWMVPPVNAVRQMQTHGHPIAMLRAIRDGRYAAAICIPVLELGIGWNFARGYLVGDRRGRTECLACRARLKPNHQ